MKRVVIAVTGSTGAVYGVRALQICHELKDVETHAVVSSGAEATLRIETRSTRDDLKKYADYFYEETDFEAAIASGSFKTSGMIVAPCSMKTLSSIATGYENNLISRAASVHLKERRPLILLTRETPLSLIHLRNMVQVTEAGGVIMPPLPPLYFEMNNFEKMVDLTVGRALSLIGVETEFRREWGR
jgi:4-hydroxy-3-polyprenylbenzoate decarboxylase